LIFCSLLFNACPGLQPPESDSQETEKIEKLIEAAKMLDEQADPNDTREERCKFSKKKKKVKHNNNSFQLSELGQTPLTLTGVLSILAKLTISTKM